MAQVTGGSDFHGVWEEWSNASLMLLREASDTFAKVARFLRRSVTSNALDDMPTTRSSDRRASFWRAISAADSSPVVTDSGERKCWRAPQFARRVSQVLQEQVHIRLAHLHECDATFS